MKQMQYSKERTCIILDKGIRKGFRWCIVSYGTHPCAYVGIPIRHKFYRKDYDKILVDCHCGLTFAKKDLQFNPIALGSIWWIGWDYAHSSDYMGYYELEALKQFRDSHKHDKKWTTKEIKRAVFKVIKQLG